MIQKIRGELEIDYDRGVIYFHASDPRLVARFGTVTLLRVCHAHLEKDMPVDITMGINGTQVAYVDDSEHCEIHDSNCEGHTRKVHGLRLCGWHSATFNSHTDVIGGKRGNET